MRPLGQIGVEALHGGLGLAQLAHVALVARDLPRVLAGARALGAEVVLQADQPLGVGPPVGVQGRVVGREVLVRLFTRLVDVARFFGAVLRDDGFFRGGRDDCFCRGLDWRGLAYGGGGASDGARLALALSVNKWKRVAHLARGARPQIYIRARGV